MLSILKAQTFCTSVFFYGIFLFLCLDTVHRPSLIWQITWTHILERDQLYAGPEERTEFIIYFVRFIVKIITCLMSKYTIICYVVQKSMLCFSEMLLAHDRKVKHQIKNTFMHRHQHTTGNQFISTTNTLCVAFHSLFINPYISTYPHTSSSKLKQLPLRIQEKKSYNFRK